MRGRGEPEGRAYSVWRPVVRALAGLAAGEPDPALSRCWAPSRAPAARSSACSSTTPSRTCWPRPRRTRRCVLVLDDLHWADASSLRLLAHVVATEPARGAARRRLHRGRSRVPGGAGGDRGRLARRADRARAAWPRRRARAVARRGRAADRRRRPPRARAATRSTSPSWSACSPPRAPTTTTTSSTLVPDAGARGRAPARRAARRRVLRGARGRRGRRALHDRRPRRARRACPAPSPPRRVDRGARGRAGRPPSSAGHFALRARDRPRRGARGAARAAARRDPRGRRVAR